MGSCDFAVGDVSWSPNSCAKELVTAAKALEAKGATVAGVCVQVRVA